MIKTKERDPDQGEFRAYAVKLTDKELLKREISEDDQHNPSFKSIIREDENLLICMTLTEDKSDIIIEDLTQKIHSKFNPSEDGDRTIFKKKIPEHLGQRSFPCTSLPLGATLPHLKQEYQMWGVVCFFTAGQSRVSELDATMVNAVLNMNATKYIPVDPTEHDPLSGMGVDKNIILLQLVSAAAHFCNSGFDLFLKALNRACKSQGEVDPNINLMAAHWFEVLKLFKQQRKALVAYFMFFPAAKCVQCRPSAPLSPSVKAALENLTQLRIENVGTPSEGDITLFDCTCFHTKFENGLADVPLTIPGNVVREFMERHNAKEWGQLTVLFVQTYRQVPTEEERGEDSIVMPDHVISVENTGCFIMFPTMLVISESQKNSAQRKNAPKTPKAAKKPNRPAPKKAARSVGVGKCLKSGKDEEPQSAPGTVVFLDQKAFMRAVQEYGCRLTTDKDGIVTEISEVPDNITGIYLPGAKFSKPVDNKPMDPASIMDYLLDPDLSQQTPRIDHGKNAEAIRLAHADLPRGSMGKCVAEMFANAFGEVADRFPLQIGDAQFQPYFDPNSAYPYQKNAFDFDAILNTLRVVSGEDVNPANANPGDFVNFCNLTPEFKEARDAKAIAGRLIPALAFCMPKGSTMAEVVRNIISTRLPSADRERNERIQHIWEVSCLVVAICHYTHHQLGVEGIPLCDYWASPEKPMSEHARRVVVEACNQTRDWEFNDREIEKYKKEDGKTHPIQELALQAFFMALCASDEDTQFDGIGNMEKYTKMTKRLKKELKTRFFAHFADQKERFRNLKLSMPNESEEFSLFGALEGAHAPADTDGKKKKKRRKKAARAPDPDCTLCGAVGEGCMVSPDDQPICMKCFDGIPADGAAVGAAVGADEGADGGDGGVSDEY
jgi:hypothetical protein